MKATGIVRRIDDYVIIGTTAESPKTRRFANFVQIGARDQYA